MVEYSIHLGTVFAIFFLSMVIWAISKNKSHKAEYGTGLERKVERETGLGRIAKRVRSIQKEIKAEEKEVKSKEKKEKGEKSASKKRGSEPAEVEVEKGAVAGAKAAVDSEKSAEALTAIEGREVGLIAGLKLIEQAIEKYVDSEEHEETKEEQEVEYMNKLISNISQVISYKQIDSHVISYLTQFTDTLIQYLNAEVGTESKKEENMKELMRTLRIAIKEIRQVLNEVRTETGVFRKFERTEQKDYTVEIMKLAMAIKAKQIKLIALKITNKKGANENLIKNLEREIALMRKQHSSATRLHSKLQRTFKMMDREIRETRRILRVLLTKEKSVVKFDRAVEKAESDAEMKVKQMKDSFHKLEQAVSAFRSSKDTHLIALSLSKNLNEFLKENEKAELLTNESNNKLREIVATGFEMARLSEAYERMIQGLTDAEKAVNVGMEVLTKVMQSVTSDEEMKLIEGEVNRTVGKLTKVLDYEERIERYLTRFVRSLEQKFRNVAALIDRLREEDRRLANSIERSSQNLGSLMTHATNRKIEVDKRYMSQADQFAGQLKQRNAAATRVYRQARRSESRAK